MNLYNPARHLPAKLRRHIKTGGRLNTHRMAFYALRSAIRAQGEEATANAQHDGLVSRFGRIQAHALFIAAAQSSR